MSENQLAQSQRGLSFRSWETIQGLVGYHQCNSRNTEVNRTILVMWGFGHLTTNCTQSKKGYPITESNLKGMETAASSQLPDMIMQLQIVCHLEIIP